MLGVCVCKVMVERQHVTPQVGTVPRGVDPGPGEESFLLWSASGKSCGASSRAEFPWRFLKFFRIPLFLSKGNVYYPIRILKASFSV